MVNGVLVRTGVEPRESKVRYGGPLIKSRLTVGRQPLVLIIKVRILALELQFPTTIYLGCSVIILLAGPSCSGKSSLARTLCQGFGRVHVSTSRLLKSRAGNVDDARLFQYGNSTDAVTPQWLAEEVHRAAPDGRAVVDCIRSDQQLRQFASFHPLLVNVRCSRDVRYHRATSRDRPISGPEYSFPNPDVIWDSDIVSVSSIAAIINQMTGSGFLDVIVGGQYGSEGKGKLAALLGESGSYSMLVRSGGPNAGHWVRDANLEFCYHHLPSASGHAGDADILIAAGATLGPSFGNEVVAVSGFRPDISERLFVDPNVVLISDGQRESEQSMVQSIGSTAQGVGAATAARIRRNPQEPVLLAGQADGNWPRWTRKGPVSDLIAMRLSQGQRGLVEGTQGSGLSLFHGPYPFTTSRDTNVGGLSAEVGFAPQSVRDVWAVIRSFPIRVGGNSGPMYAELKWEDMARVTGRDLGELKASELTSTTKRQRRIGEFDYGLARKAVAINGTNKLFLTFADYVDPAARGVRTWNDLPYRVRAFVQNIEDSSGAMVCGVSTGPTQVEVAWR